MTPSPTRALLGALGLAVPLLAAPLRAADLYRDPAAPVEARVADLLPRLTAEEKLLLLGGDRDFYIRPIPRLGLPEVKMADGPLGVRNYGPSTAYPATIGLAASWDAELGHRFGAAMGSDARARGVGILLAPAVNITRVPINGRNFEYLAEDPYLAGVFANQIVAGIQAQGVVATVKHFAANNQETNRDTIDVRVSERALREIYLPAFRAAVEKGHAWAVMDAYNRLNGTYCSANDWLNNKVLKGDWAFPGVVMSDWGAAHETLGVANGGLDLEMPSGVYLNPATLAPLLASGAVAQATIDDKVRRILRLEVANGFLDRAQEVAATPKDDPKSAAVALQIEREAIVLLKNDYNALPLANKKFKRIVLLGPNAANFPVGGGSGHVESFHYVSVADGLRKVLPKTKLDVIAGPGPELLARMLPTARYEGPLQLKFFTGDWQHMKQVAALADPAVNHDWTGEPAPGVPLADYWAQWAGKIRVPADGKYLFLVRNHGNVAVNLDGKQIMGSWSNPGDTLYTEVALAAGSVHAIEIWVRYDNLGSAGVHFAWGAVPPLLTPEEEERVRTADAVVVCAGFNLMLEGEGADRPYDLPDGQPDLIRRAAALNARTIVVLNSGGSLATADWIGHVPAVLQAWYPGQEGGRAVAEVLTGKVNPSGRLPISYEKKWEDTPSFGHYPGTGGKVGYDEGILVGYRWFDSKGVAPLFPFGFGLSYTTFHYDKIHVEPRTDGTWAVTFDVTNNGTMGGSEVAQVYVSAPVTSKVPRPVRELKGFSRFELATDQTANVTVVLDRSAFSYWDEKKGAWAVEPGTYTLEVGSSSRKILLSGAVEVD